MDKIPVTTLVHAGVEIIIISGVVFWFQREVSGLKETVNIQQDTIKKLEAAIQHQQQILEQHDDIIRRLIGAPPAQGPTSGRLPQQPPKPLQKKPPVQSPVVAHQPQTPVNQPKPVVVEIDDESSSDEGRDSEVDNLLASELEDIVNERKKEPVELVFDELDDLKNDSHLTRARRRKRGRKKRARET